MRRFKECQIQDVGGVTSANAYGYITPTCKSLNTTKKTNKFWFYFKEASISRNRTKNQIVAQKMISIKRKVGYSDDEIAETRKRMSLMHLE